MVRNAQKQIWLAAGFLIFGMILWRGTLFIRGHYVVKNQLLLVLLGGMPNFGTAWMLPSFLIIIGMIVTKQEVSLKALRYLLLGTLVAQGISESYFSIYGGAAFEWLDLVFGAIALIILGSSMKQLANKGGINHD